MQIFNLIDNKQRLIWIILQVERICFKSQSDERSAASVISVLRRSHYRKASASTGTDRGECENEVAVTVHLFSVLQSNCTASTLEKCVSPSITLDKIQAVPINTLGIAGPAPNL